MSLGLATALMVLMHMEDTMEETVYDFGSPKVMTKLTEFRYVVPQSTYSGAAKLQQAWRDQMTGDVEWRDVERVVVSDEEFNRE